MHITRICEGSKILDVTSSLFILSQQIIESDSYSTPSHLCNLRNSLFDKFISQGFSVFTRANNIVQARIVGQKNVMNFQLRVLIRVKQRIHRAQKVDLTLAVIR